MFIYLNKRGQSTLEYGIVIAVIVAALIAMQIYFKRGVQGKLKQSTDDIGTQFSPGQTNLTITTNSSATSDETVSGGSLEANTMPITDTTTNQSQDRSENVTVGYFNEEYMP